MRDTNPMIYGRPWWLIGGGIFLILWLALWFGLHASYESVLLSSMNGNNDLGYLIVGIIGTIIISLIFFYSLIISFLESRKGFHQLTKKRIAVFLLYILILVVATSAPVSMRLFPMQYSANANACSRIAFSVIRERCLRYVCIRKYSNIPLQIENCIQHQDKDIELNNPSISLNDGLYGKDVGLIHSISNELNLYSNSNMGYSFQYPKEWGEPKITFASASSREEAGMFVDKSGTELVSFSVRIPYGKDGSTRISFDELTNDLTGTEFDQYFYKKDVLVAGLKAVRVEYLHKQVLAGQSPKSTTVIYIPMPDGRVFEFAESNIKELGIDGVFNEIVSSINRF